MLVTKRYRNRYPSLAPADRIGDVLRFAVASALALAWCACSPSVAIEAADEASAPAARALVSSGSSVRFDRPGVTVITDAEWMSRHNVEWQTCAVGFFDGVDRIYLASVTEWSTCVNGDKMQTTRLTERGEALVLAHELGHSAGLQHTAHGLMAPYDQSCLGTEAACLLEALTRRE